MLTDLRASSGAERRALEFSRGLSSAKAQDLDAISPAQFAAKADAPVLLIHGENDTVVPIEQSQLMDKALRQAGKPVEFIAMKGEDHWLSIAATRQVMLEKTAAFVEKHDPAN
jgi:dipeptidyl aminopeptidase/acylaminoacyl peptidase